MKSGQHPQTLTRAPAARLRPFVKALWVSHTHDGTGGREHILPTGCFHIVLRLMGPPVRLYRDVDDVAGETLGSCLVGGVRDSFYVRAALGPSMSLGAQLQPGAAAVLLGAPADQLTGRHTRLDDVWGPAPVRELRERLLSATSQAEQLAILEGALLRRLPPQAEVDRAVVSALRQIGAQDAIHQVVQDAGLSHRHLIARFTQAVGVSPKRLSRILRFQRAATWLAQPQPPSLARVALASGYADQAHFSREFRSFAGMSPGVYRHLDLHAPNHVPQDGQISSRRDRTHR